MKLTGLTYPHWQLDIQPPVLIPAVREKFNFQFHGLSRAIAGLKEINLMKEIFLAFKGGRFIPTTTLFIRF